MLKKSCIKAVTNDYYRKQVLRKTAAPEYQTYRISECSIYLSKNTDIKSGENCISEVS